MRSSRCLLLSIALGLSVLLSACGNSSSPAASGSGSSSSSSSGASSGSSSSSSSSSGSSSGAAVSVGHVFVVILENESYSTTFASGSPAQYLSTILPTQGVLLKDYYGTGHQSNDNYIAMISGQGPNVESQADCQIYDQFVGSAPQASLDGQAVGQGCVFPANVPSLPDQLEAANLTWKAYMEDMGNDQTRDGTDANGDCGHPTLNSQDGTQSGTAIDNYATRHNPFVYFQAITGDSARCSHVVPLGSGTAPGNANNLVNDLKSVATTPNFVFITPNLCHDGHDATCTNTSETGGLGGADAFLQNVLAPAILNSPAFQQDGLLIVTFDEASTSDASSCCGEGPGPNSAAPGITGTGGGVVGAVLVSPRFINPNTVSTTAYNHYSMLRSIEDLFGLQYLGYAGASGQASFGSDVFTKAMPVLPPKSSSSSSGGSSSGSSSGA